MKMMLAEDEVLETRKKGLGFGGNKSVYFCFDLICIQTPENLWFQKDVEYELMLLLCF